MPTSTPPIVAGEILPKGRVLSSRDARIELPWPAFVNAVRCTGKPGVRGEHVVYYTYIKPVASRLRTEP